MDKVRLINSGKTGLGIGEHLFLSLINLYNPRPDIENIQFIICRYAKTPRSVSGVLEFCDRSEQNL